jgi:hypothetical protein
VKVDLAPVAAQHDARSAALDAILAPERRTPAELRWLAAQEGQLRWTAEQAPRDPVALNNLGWVRQMRGDEVAAAASYEAAMRLAPSLRVVRRNLAAVLTRLGRHEEAFGLYYAEMNDEEGQIWLQEMVSAAMGRRDLTLAGQYAEVYAQLRWGTRWYPEQPAGAAYDLPVQPKEVFLTVPKLRHDIEQLDYLMARGVLGPEFRDVMREYERAAERLAARGADLRVPVDAEEHASIADIYNRIVHVRRAGRTSQALSDRWDAGAVESQYLDMPLGLAVVDDFLTDDALREVRQFCLESTVWSGNRYGHGRLGAFFFDGFTAPVLLQIAEELRAALPNVILDEYPLTQLWGFKNGSHLPAGATTHADFAAVNVNFWITPESANCDPASGGLVVYDVDAPLSWDFHTYNGRSDAIGSLLRYKQARAVKIPYRENRAIIFNSDLFHASDGLHFRSGYTNRRINVTMLYGHRESDMHHRDLVGEQRSGAIGAAAAWRSGAFSRARGR